MKKATLLLLFLITSALSFAQNHSNGAAQGRRAGFNKQEFRLRMQDYITKGANLTQEEAKAFFPIYNEYKDKQRKIHTNIHRLKKDVPAQGNEKAHEERLLKIARLNAEVAGLDSVYYKKICKAISAQKFFKILNIEDRMHRKMLQNYNKPRPRDNKTRP